MAYLDQYKGEKLPFELQWLFYLMINKQKEITRQRYQWMVDYRDTSGWWTTRPVFSRGITIDCRNQGAWDMEGAGGTESENSCDQRKEGEDWWPKNLDTEGMLQHQFVVRCTHENVVAITQGTEWD